VAQHRAARAPYALGTVRQLAIGIPLVRQHVARQRIVIVVVDHDRASCRARYAAASARLRSSILSRAHMGPQNDITRNLFGCLKRAEQRAHVDQRFFAYGPSQCVLAPLACTTGCGADGVAWMR
jgi:hypothetical protein